MKSLRKVAVQVAACAVLITAGSALAQTPPYAPPQNVMQLTARGSVEVQQDLLSLSLFTTRDGTDAASVQSQLQAALDTALAQARTAVQPGQLDVRTGHFGLAPRYSREGKITGWSGTAELVLEGRDFARITQTAARIPVLAVGGVQFGLSREQRARVEREAQAIAIDAFKAKAAELAKGFGFSGYSLREVAVNSNDQGPGTAQRMMAAAASGSPAGMPLPVEAGRSTVIVTVSGSVQLR